MRRRRLGIATAAVLLAAVLIVSQLPGSPVRLAVFRGGLGALEGTVRVAGDEPLRATVVGNTTDPEVCGRTQSLEDLLVDEPTRGVANVVVSLVDVPDSLSGGAPAPRRLLIDNRDCRFVPHVSVAALGDTLEALNSDPVFHTTHYYGPLESNVALTAPGQRVPSIVEQTGLITVLCDLHGWMRAFIRVDDHRFHDVSDARGRYRVQDIPPGTYTVEVWHERLGTRRLSVEVEPGRATRIDVELDAPEEASEPRE